MVLKNLLRRKTRTLLTVLGIGIGVAAVVALGAMAEGYINSYTTILTSSGADVIVTQSDAVDIILSAVDDTVAPQLAVIPGVKQVSGVVISMITTPEVPYFVIFGLEPNTFGMEHYKVVEGQPVLRERQTILGKTAAKNFKKKIGDNFKIQDVSFRIVGIYETGQGVEDMGAVISLKDAQAVFKKPRQVTYYQLKSTRPEMTEGAIKEIERRFPKLAASRSANFMDEQSATAMLRAMGWFIGILAVIGGGLGMMNTMLMSVFERTREIGVLRALGWRRGRVIAMIVGEAFLLCLVGGIVGSAIGAWLVYALNQIPALVGMFDNTLTPALFAQGMLIALFLGAAGGIYPAWRAARLQPVEAMRYEGAGSQVQSSKFKVKSQHPTSNFQLPISNFQSLISNFGGLALRNVFRQRTRTLLTTLAIGVGVGLVVLLGGIAEGFVDQLGAMGSASGELTISEAKAADMGLAAIEDKVGKWTATLPGVAEVSGMLFGVASVPGTPYFFAMGLEPTSYAIRHYAITEGERLRSPREIIIGKIAAKNLKKKVGDPLSVSGGSYRIVGIYETGTSYEDAGGIMVLSEAQRIFKKPNQVSFYFVKLKDPSQADAVKQAVEARWPQVSVSRSSEFADKTNDMQSFRAMANALSFLSVLIGGVGIMNAMLMSVYERTREIGTLRALGWRRRRVVGMIVREALALSFVSGIVGIVFGMGLGALLMQEPSMGSFLKPSYTLPLLIQAIVVAMILGSVGASYPAWRAANLSPIEALRYE
ncbi:MAG: FtsX-like permease family protein [Chloroflexi bacterium]|nr:FtsX-like permease family protein [Chloroflexota bacterium]